MAEEQVVYITRSQIASARGLIELLGEDAVNENVRKIAQARPNQRMVFRPYEPQERDAS